jgi:hypothetical protein
MAQRVIDCLVIIILERSYNMLKEILIITICLPQLGDISSAYTEFFAYQVAESGIVSAALADQWDTPASAGRPSLLMQPADGSPVYLRFIEQAVPEGYAPLSTQGWNAIELLVSDPDELADRLADSPFEIIGPPKDLWDAPNAPRAMQARGPGDEILYLTRNGNFETRLFVDRVFIMVLGGPSMSAFQQFYSENMGIKVGEATPFAISVLARAQGAPEGTTYPLAMATVSENFMIELDEYPDFVPARPVSTGALPPGIAMVSFIADDLNKMEVEWRVAPAPIDEAPYNGRRVGVTSGPAGEWIEVIESN